jgi:hypothetical protein
MEEITAHPLFVPASLILGALVLFAIVLYANSPKKRPRKNLQLAEAQRITADVPPTQYIPNGEGKEVRRSSRCDTKQPVGSAGWSAVAHTVSWVYRVSKPPAPYAEYMTPSKVSDGPVCVLHVLTAATSVNGYNPFCPC